MKKYKIIAAIVGFYALLAAVVWGLNRDRVLFRPGVYRGMGIVDTDIPNRVGDFAIDVAGACIVIGIVALIVYKIIDIKKCKEEKKAEREKELRK